MVEDALDLGVKPMPAKQAVAMFAGGSLATGLLVYRLDVRAFRRIDYSN